jgi:hypothetical protein
MMRAPAGRDARARPKTVQSEIAKMTTETRTAGTVAETVIVGDETGTRITKTIEIAEPAKGLYHPYVIVIMINCIWLTK